MRRLPIRMALCLGLAVVPVAVAGSPAHPKGKPFQAMQNESDALRAEISALRAEVEELRDVHAAGVDPVVLVDAEGQVLGPTIPFSNFLFRANGKAAILLAVDAQTIDSAVARAFVKRDCQGTSYLPLPGGLFSSQLGTFDPATGKVF